MPKSVADVLQSKLIVYIFVIGSMAIMSVWLWSFWLGNETPEGIRAPGFSLLFLAFFLRLATKRGSINSASMFFKLALIVILLTVLSMYVYIFGAGQVLLGL